MRIHLLTLIACGVTLASGTVAAGDLFAGRWKLNPAASTISGATVLIESDADGTYRFTSTDRRELACRMDGLPRQLPGGATLTCSQLSSRSWEMTVSVGGRMASRSKWILAPDQQRLTIVRESPGPGGKMARDTASVQRVVGTKGLAGMWRAEKLTFSLPAEFEIQTDGAGHRVIGRSAGSNLTIRYDGREYPVTGADVPSGSTTSGRRIDGNTIEITDRRLGKVTGTARVSVSADGKRLTQVYQAAGAVAPSTYVYDRQ